MRFDHRWFFRKPFEFLNLVHIVCFEVLTEASCAFLLPISLNPLFCYPFKNTGTGYLGFHPVAF